MKTQKTVRDAMQAIDINGAIEAAIIDAGRTDLLDEAAVVIPPRTEFESASIWIDDSYNTMIDASGEWITDQSASVGFIAYVRACIEDAGMAWHTDCDDEGDIYDAAKLADLGYGDTGEATVRLTADEVAKLAADVDGSVEEIETCRVA